VSLCSISFFYGLLCIYLETDVFHEHKPWGTSSY
jgi:hypothetical protein